MCDFRCCGAIKDCNETQYVEHYVISLKQNTVFSNCFIEKKPTQNSKKQK